MDDKLEATINSQGSLTDFCKRLVDFWVYHKWVRITVTATRTLTQNATIRLCYKQIRQHNEGWTPKYVERLCKLTYGVPILNENEVDAWVFGQILPKLNYEQQLKVMDSFSVTSKFTASQANLFIAQLIEDFPYIQIEKKKNGKYV